MASAFYYLEAERFEVLGYEASFFGLEFLCAVLFFAVVKEAAEVADGDGKGEDVDVVAMRSPVCAYELNHVEVLIEFAADGGFFFEHIALRVIHI